MSRLAPFGTVDQPDFRVRIIGGKQVLVPANGPPPAGIPMAVPRSESPSASVSALSARNPLTGSSERQSRLNPITGMPTHGTARTVALDALPNVPAFSNRYAPLGSVAENASRQPEPQQPAMHQPQYAQQTHPQHTSRGGNTARDAYDHHYGAARDVPAYGGSAGDAHGAYKALPPIGHSAADARGGQHASASAPWNTETQASTRSHAAQHQRESYGVSQRDAYGARDGHAAPRDSYGGPAAPLHTQRGAYGAFDREDRGRSTQRDGYDGYGRPVPQQAPQAAPQSQPQAPSSRRAPAFPWMQATPTPPPARAVQQPQQPPQPEAHSHAGGHAQDGRHTQRYDAGADRYGSGAYGGYADRRVGAHETARGADAYDPPVSATRGDMTDRSERGARGGRVEDLQRQQEQLIQMRRQNDEFARGGYDDNGFGSGRYGSSRVSSDSTPLGIEHREGMRSHVDRGGRQYGGTYVTDESLWRKENGIPPEDDRVRRFSSLYNALRQSDAEGTGYLDLHEARRLIETYNLVYSLSIPQTLVDALFTSVNPNVGMVSIDDVVARLESQAAH